MLKGKTPYDWEHILSCPWWGLFSLLLFFSDIPVSDCEQSVSTQRKINKSVSQSSTDDSFFLFSFLLLILILELLDLLIQLFLSDLQFFRVRYWYGNQPKGKYGMDYLDDQDQE